MMLCEGVFRWWRETAALDHWNIQLSLIRLNYKLQHYGRVPDEDGQAACKGFNTMILAWFCGG